MTESFIGPFLQWAVTAEALPEMDMYSTPYTAADRSTAISEIGKQRSIVTTERIVGNNAAPPPATTSTATRPCADPSLQLRADAGVGDQENELMWDQPRRFPSRHYNRRRRNQFNGLRIHG